jgi:hypothetical protein
MPDVMAFRFLGDEGVKFKNVLKLLVKEEGKKKILELDLSNTTFIQGIEQLNVRGRYTQTSRLSIP